MSSLNLLLRRPILPGDVLRAARRHPLLRYGISVISVAAALATIAVARVYLAERTPVYLAFAGAVAVSAGIGGLGPGILATVACIVLVFVSPAAPASGGRWAPVAQANLAIFIALAILLSVLSEILRNAYWRAEVLREEADLARRRIAFLAEASTILDSSLDTQDTLANLARLIVPSMADWCAIDLLEGRSSFRQLGVAHADPAKEDLVRRLQSRYPLTPQGLNPLNKVLSTGQPDMYLDIPDEALVAAARDAEHLSILRQVGFRAYMCVPLRARGRTLGTILFVTAGSHHYARTDVALATDLAHRAALAVDNARLYQAAGDEIAERTRAERALQASESRLSGIIGSAMDAIISVDGSQRVVVFNQAAERMFRCSVQDAIGQPLARFIPDRFRAAHRDHIHRFGQTGETSRTMTSLGALVGLRGDGEEFPIEATVSQVDAAGERIYTVIMRDVTDRVHAEEEIRQLNERLQQSMTETHHRVKNNLQIVAAMVDMQVMDDGQSVPVSELRRLGGYVRALAIVHDLLTQGSRLDAQAEVVSAREMLEKLLPLIQLTAGDGTVVRYRLDDARLTARQTTSLALVVNELVSNAIKHGRGEVDVALRASDGCATLEVLDNGPGFPADFDPNEAANTGLELVCSLSRWDLRGGARFANRPEGGGSVVVDIHLEEQAAPPLPA